jgi:hypothetical protein
MLSHRDDIQKFRRSKKELGGFFRENMANKSVNANPNAKNEESPDESKDFLLAEFNESADAWRYSDAKIESVIKFYLSVFSATGPVLAVLYNYLTDFKIFMGITIIADCCLVGMGLVAIQSIFHSEIRKAEYLHSIQLVRKYFADHDATILPYLYFRTAEPVIGNGKSSNQIQPLFSKVLATGINIVNSILIGWIVSGCTWLVMKNSLTQLLLIGSVIAIIW